MELLVRRKLEYPEKNLSEQGRESQQQNQPRYSVDAVIWTRISNHCATLATLNPLGCLLLVGSGDIHTPPGWEWLCDGSALLRPLNWRTRTIKRTRFKLSVSPRGESRGGPPPIFRPNWRKFETAPHPLISGYGWPTPAPLCKGLGPPLSPIQKANRHPSKVYCTFLHQKS